jgi:sugar-phosphatase
LPPDVAAVLFDMDGTLVDSDAAVARAWVRWAQEAGVDPALALAGSDGFPARATIARVRPDLEGEALEAAARRQMFLQYDDVADVIAIRGAVALLAFLAERGIPWAVVTSADRRLATNRLRAAGIEATVVVTVEDVDRGKPDPAGFLRAAELLGVAPGRCLVVEDAEPGVAAARAAGVAAVAALKGVPGDIAIADLGELIPLLGGPGH